MATEHSHIYRMKAARGKTAGRGAVVSDSSAGQDRLVSWPWCHGRRSCPAPAAAMAPRHRQISDAIPYRTAVVTSPLQHNIISHCCMWPLSHCRRYTINHCCYDDDDIILIIAMWSSCPGTCVRKSSSGACFLSNTTYIIYYSLFIVYYYIYIHIHICIIIIIIIIIIMQNRFCAVYYYYYYYYYHYYYSWIL